MLRESNLPWRWPVLLRTQTVMRIFYLFFFKRRPNAPLWPLIYSGLYQSAANYHSALCLLALPILGNLVSFLTFISSGSFTQISQVVFQRRARSPSSNNAGEMAEGCLLKRMQESKFQSWRVMDISQRKITQSNTTCCWGFLMNTTQSDAASAIIIRGAISDMARMTCNLAVHLSSRSFFPLQTAC